ncbi:MerR family transcriptional regulator [Streptomyces sp. Je 1-369]|uniref:MerR family transcriptional regulator n=1 Tax=Streptomyces sp. Je 1-369 TaxID=2966192 RepID=UPI0022855ED2|nr:MerR family transcriptional regulator [Streptomyces sp. Je 1-369]WAL93285.1 MerR family transcriptional regulator [Streptomyces sp. Je 1-369]
MLTIGELASYAGVTVRAVRHYHARGLLPEPERDHSGYRRYGAGAVVELLRIRTLAEAGVPLARVRELLQADEEEFAAAIVDIDERLRAEMRERQRHRERIARLAAGDSLALPREVVAYLDRLRALGIDERIVQVERDNWIPLAARSPERIPEWMARKREQIADPQIVDFYVTLSEVLARAPARAPGRAPDRATDRGSDRAEDRALDRAEDDPRLAELADKLAACVTQLADEQGESQVDDTGIEPLLAELLDAHVYETLPPTRRLIELLTKRGWTGWTKLERVPALVGHCLSQ